MLVPVIQQPVVEVLASVPVLPPPVEITVQYQPDHRISWATQKLPPPVLTRDPEPAAAHSETVKSKDVLKIVEVCHQNNTEKMLI